MDGLPEAIEMPDRRFVLGVQWHPEADDTSRVVGALVAHATEHMCERVKDGTMGVEAGVARVETETAEVETGAAEVQSGTAA